MNTHIFFSPLLFSISIFILIADLPIAYCDDNLQFLECNQTSDCGTTPDLGYPFWGGVRPRYCGHEGFELIFEENQSPVSDMNTQKFRLLNIDQETGTMRMAPLEIWENPCPQRFYNISLNHSLLNFAATVRTPRVFYGCPLGDNMPSQNRFSCGTSNVDNYAYFLDETLLRLYGSQLIKDCNISITVPANQIEVDELWSGNYTVEDVWNKGFDVLYQKQMLPCTGCMNSGGVCGSDNTSFEFLCFCHDQPYPLICLTLPSGMQAFSLCDFLFLLQPIND